MSLVQSEPWFESYDDTLENSQNLYQEAQYILQQFSNYHRDFYALGDLGDPDVYDDEEILENLEFLYVLRSNVEELQKQMKNLLKKTRVLNKRFDQISTLQYVSKDFHNLYRSNRPRDPSIRHINERSYENNIRFYLGRFEELLTDINEMIERATPRMRAHINRFGSRNVR
jgi:hypothetical protein